ncbi:MAG: zinc ABC transporter substrate-binding protein [Clostridia bacterium]|nr:zinc ABC transporter substrate-binding protein [Clostridia bacterium]
MKKFFVFRILSVFLCLTLLCGGSAACSNHDLNFKNEGVLYVVCTNAAAFDLARAVVIPEDNNQSAHIEVLLLGRPGQDMHSYEPSAQDIITLSTADLVVSVGDTAEGWLANALSASGNKNVRRVKMMEVCGTVGHDHEEDCDLDHDHNELTDEHVWVSVKNAEKISRAIADAALEVIGDTNAALSAGISAKRDAYCAQLLALDKQYTDMVASAERTELVIADRYPFVHLMHDYGLTCHAAFPGCSSETEASFATQTQLIETVKFLDLPYIFVIDGSDRKVAETVAKETSAEILVLHSYQVLTEAEITSGLSYLDVAKANLENLRKALCE